MQVCYQDPGLASMMLKNPGDHKCMQDLLASSCLMIISMSVGINQRSILSSIHPVPEHTGMYSKQHLCAESLRVSLIHLLVQQGSIHNLLQRTWLRCTQVVTYHVAQAANPMSAAIRLLPAGVRICRVEPQVPLT